MRYVDKRQPSNARPADRRTAAARRSIQRRHTAGHTGTRPSPHSATRYGCLPEPQPTTRPSIEHTAGPAKRRPIHGSQPTALTAPNPDLPNLYSTAAVQDTTTCSHNRWRLQATDSPDTGLSRQHPEARYRHLADRQPLDLQPHRRDPAVRHSRSLETHRQHGDARNQSATSRMGFGSLPGEANGSEGRLPRHEQRQNLQPGTQVPARHRATEPTKSSPNSATAAARTPSSPATFQTTP